MSHDSREYQVARSFCEQGHSYQANSFKNNAAYLNQILKRYGGTEFVQTVVITRVDNTKDEGVEFDLDSGIRILESVHT